ncbi:hypothetical protein [Pseudophaeobacter sp. TrK17]|uniref:hypothetical protein n=1 Tax=Pseudophaeobacter sp. TrK17 TaxID=2815167 RepID=UPI0035CE8870
MNLLDAVDEGNALYDFRHAVRAVELSHFPRAASPNFTPSKRTSEIYPLVNACRHDKRSAPLVAVFGPWLTAQRMRVSPTLRIHVTQCPAPPCYFPRTGPFRALRSPFEQPNSVEMEKVDNCGAAACALGNLA